MGPADCIQLPSKSQEGAQNPARAGVLGGLGKGVCAFQMPQRSPLEGVAGGPQGPNPHSRHNTHKNVNDVYWCDYGRCLVFSCIVINAFYFVSFYLFSPIFIINM